MPRGSYGGSSDGIVPTHSLWAQAVVNNGGTVSAAREALVSALTAGLQMD